MRWLMLQHRYAYPTVIELCPDPRTARHDETLIARFAELVEELLDAHSDTVAFEASDLRSAGWAAHLDYLKDLQRVGRRSLAELA